MDFVFEFAVESLLIGLVTAALSIPFLAGIYACRDHYNKLGIPVVLGCVILWFIAYQYITAAVV